MNVQLVTVKLVGKLDWRFLSKENLDEYFPRAQYRSYLCSCPLVVCVAGCRCKGSIVIFFDRVLYEKKTGTRLCYPPLLVVESPWLFSETPVHVCSDSKQYLLSVRATNESDNITAQTNESSNFNDCNAFIGFLRRFCQHVERLIRQEVARHEDVFLAPTNILIPFLSQNSDKGDTWIALNSEQYDENTTLLFLNNKSDDSQRLSAHAFDQTFCRLPTDKKYFKLAVRLPNEIECGFLNSTRDILVKHPTVDVMLINYKFLFSARNVRKRAIQFAIAFTALQLPIYVALDIFDWLEIILTANWLDFTCSFAKTISKQWIETTYRVEKLAIMQRIQNKLMQRKD